MTKSSPIPAQSAQDRGKLTVVLDVDETLIHSRLSGGQEAYRQQEERKAEAKALDEFTIKLRDSELVRVNKRPGLDAFLAEASKHYELVAYTAGLEEYARPLLDWLDPNGTIFRHRLYRDSCLFMRGYYLKDLQRLNRPLKRIVLVDNNAFCFLPQLANGIPISSFYDDATDTALQVLLTFLERIADMADVRPFLKTSFNLEVLLQEHRAQICE
jgi:Dullard-like phosphatase family protein